MKILDVNIQNNKLYIDFILENNQCKEKLDNKLNNLLLEYFDYNITNIDLEHIKINQRYYCIFDNILKKFNFMPIS